MAGACYSVSLALMPPTPWHRYEFGFVARELLCIIRSVLCAAKAVAGAGAWPIWDLSYGMKVIAADQLLYET